jgi:glycosyltransferase involved in cell wall biosynthesis
MRIALCLEFPIALRGGVSVLVETLLEDFVRHGHEVFLVSSDSTESFRAADASKLAAGHFTWDRLNISAAASKKLAGQLAGARVDVAHFHFGGNFGFGNRIPFRCPIYFLGKLGIPCVTTVHSLSGILEGYCGPSRSLWGGDRARCLLRAPGPLLYEGKRWLSYSAAHPGYGRLCVAQCPERPAVYQTRSHHLSQPVDLFQVGSPGTASYNESIY